MAESEVSRRIREYRRGVNASEKQMLQRLARLWVPSYRYLQQQVDDLTSLIAKRLAAGETVYPEWIWSLSRYQTMMAQAQRLIKSYSKAAKGVITAAEVEAAETGRNNGRELIQIAEPDDPMWTRVNRQETVIAAGMTADDTPLDRLLDESFGETREGMEEALITGISTGQGSKWIADQMMKAAEIPEQRALLIARTEVNRAYRQANVETMRSSRAARGFRRRCYKPTACFSCLMLDGEFYPLDSEPYDHPNGKCVFLPVTRHYDPADDPDWQTGRDWLEEQSPEDQRKIMGVGRWELWHQSGVDPRSMVYIKPNDVWGGSPAVRTLEELGFGYRGKDIPKAFYMSLGSDQRIDWAGTTGTMITKEQQAELIERAQNAGIKIYAINKFDGDVAVLQEQIDAISQYRKDFPEIFEGHQPLTITFREFAGSESAAFAETKNLTITFNLFALRDREFTEKQITGDFSFTDCAGISRHEIGHILERTYGFKGLDLAYRAYENVFGPQITNAELLTFLEEIISPAAAMAKKSETGKIRISEITSEILGYNKGENKFVDEFRSLVRKERLRWLNSSTHRG